MFSDLVGDLGGIGGAVFGGKLGSDAGKTIGIYISDGNKTVETIGGLTGGLLGVYVGLEFVEGIFEDDES